MTWRGNAVLAKSPIGDKVMTLMVAYLQITAASFPLPPSKVMICHFIHKKS